MKMIKRPMKAPSESITDEKLETLNYPIVGSPKLDGIRALIGKDGVYSSSMKKIFNDFVQEELTGQGLDGLDGELIVGKPYGKDCFHNTSGAIRRKKGEPDFHFYAFDNFTRPNRPYKNRWVNTSLHYEDSNRVVVLEQTILWSVRQVLKYKKRILKQGYEGIILRSP